MFCPKCGFEIKEEMKYCSNCGFKITNDLNNSQLNIDSNKSNGDISFKDKEISETVIANNERKNINFLKTFSIYDKVIFGGIGISILLFLIALFFGSIYSISFSVLQILLLVILLFINKGVIKILNKTLKRFLLLISLLMIIPYMLLFSIDNSFKNIDKINWNEMVIGNVIPEPVSKLGEIHSNTDDYLWVNIANMSYEQYTEYLEICKNKRFTINANQSSATYDAYNEEGYKLHLSYDEEENQLSITLGAPIDMNQIIWPTSEYGKVIPIPKSTLGKIEREDKLGLEIYIGNTNISDYNAYVATCFEKGFNIDASRTENSFIAKNKDSYKLSVDYIGNNVMCISVQIPEFEIKMEIDCRENLMFSKYDMEISIDDIYEDTLTHGDTKEYDLVLTKGKHSISFKNVEDETITGKIEVDISKSGNLKLKVFCNSMGIDVENLDDNSKANDETVKNEKNKKDESETITQKEDNETILTVKNCPELDSMLKKRSEMDESYSEFSSKYSGRIIEFDGRIDYCTNHENYKTRFDYLVSAGDYNPDTQRGPTFKFENVNYNDLNTDIETVSVGLNVRIKAEVIWYNSQNGLFYLEPVEITKR